MIPLEIGEETIYISKELLDRYDRQGPRYTSYPTAPEWTANVKAKDYTKALKQKGRENNRLSLYLHIPFCERACYFCGCHTVVTQKRELVRPYLNSLEKEISTISELLGGERKVIQIEWGGGTPTYLNSAELEQLFRAIEQRFTIESDAEISIEVHPNVTSEEQIQTLRHLGFNRISMGVQDFDERVQEAVNRVEKRESVEELVTLCRSLGFRSINLDLIYGLPLQSAETFEKTVEAIIEISPDRIALFNYAHVPWMKPYQKYIRESDLPSPEVKLDIFRMAMRRFTQAGYEFIGLDHFAKPTDELVEARRNRTLKRNFMGYTTRAGTHLLGFGESAIGMLNDIYVQNEKKHLRYENLIFKDGLATVRGIRLTKEDLLRREVIMNILCHLSLDYGAIAEKFEIDFENHFAAELQELPKFEEDCLLIRDSNGFKITSLGRLFVRNIAMTFDAYLRKPAKEKPLFSRTV